jgi:hypothetical protein
VNEYSQNKPARLFANAVLWMGGARICSAPNSALLRFASRDHSKDGAVWQSTARYKETEADGIIEAAPPLRPTELAALEEAQIAIRDLATRMRAFAYNEMPARRALTFFRYDVLKASDSLTGYSNYMNTYGGAKASKKKAVEDALRVPEHTL